MSSSSAKKLATALFLTLALCALAVGPAQAAFGLKGVEVSFEDEAGDPVTEAGTHPYAIRTVFHVNSHEEKGETFPDEELRNLELFLPEGFAGNPDAMPTCAHGDFLKISPITETPSCPDDTAIGVVSPEIINPGLGAKRAVFNLDPPPGSVAEIGFVGSTVPITIDFGVSKDPPYRVVAEGINVTQAVKVYGAEVTVWGNPQDPVHDEERGACIIKTGVKCPAGETPEEPFVTMPRACGGPLFATWSVLSWQNPLGPPVTGSTTDPLEVSECQALQFQSPATEAAPTSASAESPSGLAFHLSAEDEGLLEPEGTAEADIKKIEVVLPQGITANPSAAEGLEACTKAQLGASTLTAGTGCPEASKLGTLSAQTPLLEGQTLTGSVYLASQDDNPFGSLIALYMVIRDPELGVLVKIPTRAEMDPQSGQITAVTDELPQIPLSDVSLSLRSGPRAPLVMPSACGTYAIKTTLTPYNDRPPIVDESPFTVDSGPGGGPCPSTPPFHPTFAAGTSESSASTYSPFNMRFTRNDGDAEITRLAANLPLGVVGKIAGLAKCPEAQIAAARQKSGRQELASPSCPASSKVGEVLAGAGVGPDLTYVPGSLYLAGPFGGDPVSIVAIVPAVAGPLDVGTVVNRVGLTLDPATAQAQIGASEPFPRILAGVPLRLRDLRVFANRPNFTNNATSCEPEQASAQLFSAFADPFQLTPGTPTALSAPYQAKACNKLGFAPKLSLRLLGQTARSGHPQLRSAVTYPYPSGPGYANIAKAVVTLPPSLFIDQAHINNPCTRVQFNEAKCPKKSVLGTARATTPLLDEPLEGPVYFRSNGGARPLPDIVADLHGLFHVEVIGQVDAQVKGEISRIRTTFLNVPDTPVTKFTLNLKGGKQGLLENSRNLCAGPQKTLLKFVGQNARIRESVQQIAVKGCKGGGKKKGGKGKAGK